MPKINDTYLNCVIYLYPSEEAAEEGKKTGGSGFLVAVLPDNPQGEDQGIVHCYAVTNMHVIKNMATPVITFNDINGVRKVISTSVKDWFFRPEGDDLAVCRINNPDQYKVTAISSSIFVNNEETFYDNYGVGDEVFMVGRFINHQGTIRNTPVVRFGNISMMPLEPVKQIRSDQEIYFQESFLVEMRSLSGFSGSPVFLYDQNVKVFPLKESHLIYGQMVQDRRPLRVEMAEPKFLGVDWGHLDAPYQFKKLEVTLIEDAEDIRTLNSNSGLSAVVPAWKLLALLNEANV